MSEQKNIIKKVKLNINKSERKELQLLNEEFNYVALRIGFLKTYNVGKIMSFNDLNKDNEVYLCLNDKFANLICDDINYLNFKKEYKKEGKYVFDIILNKPLSKEIGDKIKSFFN